MNSFYIIPNLVSIIIPTISRNISYLENFVKTATVINRYLENIKKNTSLDYEIIVVCNSPDDKKLLISFRLIQILIVGA